MTIRPGLSALVLVVGCVAAAVPAAAQTAPVRSVYERYTEPIQIYKNGLGTFTRPMSSSNKEAQAFFDQGFQMMYSFAKPEAVRLHPILSTNRVLLGADADPERGVALAFAAVDNLVKGAAGQAVQNANLMLGFEETTGLMNLTGSAP